MCLQAMCVPCLWIGAEWTFGAVSAKKLCRCCTAMHHPMAEGDDFLLSRRLNFVEARSRVLNISRLLGGIAEVTARGEFEQGGFGVFGYVEFADKFL